MSKKRYRHVLGALVLLTSGLFAAPNRSVPKSAGFSNASLQGSYALVGTGGANEAASVGVAVFDGQGGATRSLVLNEADPNGTGRLILEIPATGNYTVHPDGRGTAVFLNELPDGSKIPFRFDFVITEATRLPGKRGLSGTGVRMMQREPGIAAKLVVFDLHRRPE